MQETKHAWQETPPAIAIDLGGTQLRVAIVQGAKILAKVRIPTGDDSYPERTVDRMCRCIDQVLQMADVKLEQVAGLGICVAGPLDSRTGVVFAPPNLAGWDHVPLRDMLQKHYPGLAIFLENDANAASLGEYMFGAGKGCKDMVYMTVSTGIGGGVICNGQLVVGTSGTAAELGHMTIDKDGPLCNCGNTGCLESIASGTAITRRAREAITAGKYFVDPPALSLADQLPYAEPQAVARAAREGLPAAREIIRDAAQGLGIGIVNVIHVFNPEKIILGGGLLQIGELLIDPALQLVQERTMKVPYQAVDIVYAELGDDTGLVGAGALIYYNSRNLLSPKMKARVDVKSAVDA